MFHVLVHHNNQNTKESKVSTHEHADNLQAGLKQQIITSTAAASLSLC